MILQWMAYAALCAALFAGAAACIERVCASHHRARRGVWLAAIVLSVVVPVASPLTARSLGSAAPAALAEVPVTNETSPAVQSSQLDIIALTAWATASLLFATLLLVAHRRTSRVLRSCRARRDRQSGGVHLAGLWARGGRRLSSSYRRPGMGARARRERTTIHRDARARARALE